ncbi:laminin subunit beta-2 isoform X2 [Alligator mississippiensis]|uniref:laminin subunit beta-2 isoform X2 n=1 Tax=Alligator mississippiensis TaxID=8496 RepID=UPI002877DCA9|nr:laminin subunit beta-2 isoform X2 [Alligator mississippiensis]
MTPSLPSPRLLAWLYLVPASPEQLAGPSLPGSAPGGGDGGGNLLQEQTAQPRAEQGGGPDPCCPGRWHPGPGAEQRQPPRLDPLLRMELLLTLLLLAQAPAASSEEEPDLPAEAQGCAEGSCYPATGNLLVGRAGSLSATSTCGLAGPQEYCIVSHLQDSEKCFICDSRAPWGHESHRIQNIIYLQGPGGQRSWWQSENGVEQVSIRLDLEAEFHFTHLIMKFKTFRPAAMLVERSADFGRTWRVYRYFAYDCARLFPGVPVQPSGRIDEVLCDQRYSEIEPSSQGEVIFKVLDPSIPVEDPYSQDSQDLLRVTNLRVNLSKLHTLGDELLDARRTVLDKYYYAVDELVLRGSCLCYGHAAQCAPAAGGPATTDGMIHGGCQCRHHTAGPNCERCQDFYQDLPWQPAQPSDPHACRACECNGHASRCHFDMAVFLATGNTSGGVCDDCQHNTMGRRCELCKPFYYKDPARDLRDPSACLPCDCDPVGSLDGGVCDGHTDVALGLIAGQCRCKEHVRGARCDHCKEAFYGLSLNDPQGCQPCRCDPRGIIAGSAPCDHISGDCYCKRFVTGRYCSQCLPEFWGLSYDVAGCRPCACDFGGAYSNRCSAEDGMCPCRPRLMGRLCDTVQPGAFCAPLDHYTYEAEQATGHAPAHPQLPGEVRAEAPGDCLEQYNGLPHGRKGRLRRQRSAWRPRLQRAAPRRGRQLPHKPDVEAVAREPGGRMLTWTGPGFARVRDGAGLSFLVGDVPLPLEYDLLLRYEPQSTEDWEAVVSVRSQALPSSPRCGNALPSEQLYRQGLPHTQRYVLLSRPFCFEPGNRYVVAVRLQRAGAAHRHPAAFILVDSLVLLPRVMELPGFHGSEPAAVQRREEMERYTCLEAFRMATMPALPEACARLLCSISALLHDGALRCQCDPQGSTSSVCQPLGGQCPCKPHVAGRRCDRCVPGTHGFGPAGCSPCACSPEGALSRLCDPATGQCRCQPGAVGRRCDQCQPGQWGFPACRPCHCNGHAEHCDPHTGACHQCRDFTAGRHCERCLDGYYGDPVLGSGQQCRPCPCPGYPGTRSYHGTACHADKETRHIVCLCTPGYAGLRCDRCAPGYFGALEQEGGACRPCQCNNNIDPSDPEACDPRTGHCRRCLHHTDGPRCAQCQPGYYGNALQRGCRRCTCNQQGTLPSHCASGTCHCDRATGHCACRAHVVGRNCDRCAPDSWNFGGEHGCQPCACHPDHALPRGCNLFTGQCVCRPGFGGRVCAHCQEDHWGDPERECRACDCDAAGAESLQCDRASGGCTCRPGFTGPRCDQCHRGAQNDFPRCSPCHPCFGPWDQVLGQLQEQLRSLQEQARALQEGGPMPELSNSRLRELEEKLQRVEQLARVGDSPGTAALHQLDTLLDSTRRDLDEFWQQLQEVEGRLDGAAGSATGQRGRLDRLSQELQELNSTATRLRGQLGTVVGTGFGESYRSLVAAAQHSRQQQQRAQDAVQGPGSLVGHAQATRRVAERVLRERGDAFRRSAAAQGRALREAQRRAAALSIARISQQICGAPGHQGCDGAPCGGALCRDHMGHRHCGGPGCVGALPVSVRALGQAGNTSLELESVAQQLGTVALQLQEAHELARSARTHAQETLGRSQAARTHMEESTAGLRDFIRRIKAFLAEEGADPESIELVARQVLNISLPSSPGRIHHLLQEIRDSLSGLDSVDAILNGTARGLAAARDLLAQARQAQERAEGSRGAVAEMQGALAAARAKVAAAGAALQGAREVVRGVENRVKEVERRLQALEGTESQLLSRLRELAQAAGALQEKTEATRQLATQARQGAERATAATGALDQALERATQRYGELRSQVGDRAGASGDALLRATRLAQDARRLLDKASGSQRRLEELERRFEANEAALEAKAGRLRALERRVAGLLEDIRHRAGAYATC